MLRIDVRELAAGPVETRGELSPDDPALEGLDVRLGAPVAVQGRLQAIGAERFFWQGSLRTVVEGECRRCLTPLRAPIQAEISALFSTDPEALDDPDAYAVAPEATAVDLAPAVREELLLSVPRFIVCSEDCRGLCPHCGTNLNTGLCACAPAVDPRWQGLRS